MITTGLIIDEPWISRILAGEKSWEMRSTNVNKRGPIALIRKGSGLIVGVGNLVACSGPYDRAGMIENISKHTIPEAMITSGQVDKWCWAWELDAIIALENPVPYSHPNGAVIWVNLEAAVTARLPDPGQSRKTSASSASSVQAMPAKQVPISSSPESVAGKLVSSAAMAPSGGSVGKDKRVPVAKDGSRFGPHCGGRGYFQVGAKGEEKKFDTYEEALTALERMPTARWRRPNAAGNWGIVSAARWE